MTVAELVGRLAPRVGGDLRADLATRELYAADASLYRRRPRAVLRALAPDDLAAAVEVCGDLGVPLTMRGAGTSLAGQAVGPGLVVDASALCTVTVDPDRRTARVGPGVVLDALNAAAAPFGLTFGADVATASRATLGGMIANNSAGARSVVHGMTADHVRALEVVMADGGRAELRRGGPAPRALEACTPLAARWRGPSLMRRVSGYALDALAGPDPDWPRLLCGSEGTLAVTVSAEVGLVPLPEARGLSLVRFGSVDAALDAVVDLLGHSPSAIELLDGPMLDPANRAAATRGLTAFGAGAAALLVVEFSGDPGTVRDRVAGVPGGEPVLDAAGQRAVWAVRRAGIARALRGEGPGVAAGRDARPLAFIEDPAVPPARLASFAREVRRVLAGEGVPAVWYGHASVGCLHIRPLMDLREPGAVGRMRRIAETVADIVVAHDGSLSGEHGDGRIRGELLPRMYPAGTIAAFAALKRSLDPAGILNPGVIVDPEPLDAGLRTLASPRPRAHRTAIGFGREGGLGRAAEACNGNGACRARGGTMCPSYQALTDERHSTRGRAVLFRAALEGRLPGGLADDGLHEALELCLACKACAAECPASVDMARLKVEARAHRHRLRGVPLATRAVAHTPTLLAIGSRAPALARAGARLAGRVAGRPLPAPTRRWRPVSDPDPTVVLVSDTFTRFLDPGVGDDALRVLRAAGARVAVVDPGCCGRTFLSEGLVGEARSHLRRALDRLAPAALAGLPVVVLEPSCWSMLADDAPALVPGDPRAALVAAAAVPFETAVLRLGVPPLRPREGRVVVHPHCHTRALGHGDDVAALLAHVPGLDVAASGAGCCGMAGAFGIRHPRLSRAIAADRLVPAMRTASEGAAPGTSCRAQVAETAGVPARHPARILAEVLA